jgi:hypothetical protein
MSFSSASDAVLKAVNTVFGSDVTYIYLDSGDTSEIKGVFDNAFVEIQGIAAVKPILKIRLADLDADPVEGDTVTIEETVYTVIASEPDGRGSSTLILQRL